MKIIIIILIAIVLAGGIWFLFFQPKEKTNTNEKANINAVVNTNTKIYTNAQANLNKKDSNPYNWSTMDQGPYRDKISYATSPDILNWADSQKILAEHASVPGAVIKKGTIYLYFVDVTQDGIPERIGLLRSNDNGKTWLPKIFVNFSGLGNKVSVDPAPFLLDDGRIRLYYFDIAEGRSFDQGSAVNKIYSAISEDGINFTQEEGVRFQKENIFDPAVIKYGDTWRLYVGDIINNRVISATSKDGLSFTEEGIAFSGGAVPDVHFAFETYFLFTAGIDISSSQDGKTFTKTGSRFASKIGTVTADPSVIVLDDMTYLMFYKTK